jgi:hypothetical protein
MGRGEDADRPFSSAPPRGSVPPVRQAYTQQALLSMAPEADLAAVGARITLELCGAWDHEPPCPLAPHHARAERSGEEVRVRVLFAAEPWSEPEVRRRIDAALADGRLEHPAGVVTRWTVLRSDADPVSPEEAAHAERLIRG